MKRYMKSYRFFIPVYEGDENPNPTPPPPVEPISTESPVTVPPGVPPSGNGDDDKPTISQKKLNAIIAEEKRKYQKQIQDNIIQLEQLKKAQGLTTQEKDKLQAQINQLQDSLLSKEELARKERERLSKEHQSQLKGVSDERDSWRGRFTNATITRSIQDEAIKAKAFNPEQIVDLLQSKSTLDEVTDAEGRPTGDFLTKVKFSDVDKEGKPITLNLTIPEAIKRMKELPDRFGNLFESGLVGGIGGSRQSGQRGTGKRPEDMSTTEYREYRKKAGLAHKSI